MAAEEHAELEQAHPVEHERPEDWGWHADLGKQARVAGLICAILLFLLVFATHGSKWEIVWSFGTGIVILLGLAWDRNRRKNSWRG